MTWHTMTVRRSEFERLVASIRRSGGTIACSRPEPDGIRLTWTTTDSATKETDDVR